MDEQRAWIRSRRRKRLRIVAVILCMCLLVTTRADILETLSTFASEWKDSTVYVSGFVELPEEVRAQTVPLGTGIEELSLPDTLEAFAETPEEEDKPGDADKPGEGSGDTEKPDDGKGGTENPGDETGETGNPDDGGDGTENPGEGNGETGNPGGGEEGTENPGDGNGEAGNLGSGENGTENHGDGSGDAGSADEGTGDEGESSDGNDGGSGDAGNPGDGTDGGSDDAGNPDGGSDDGSGDAGNADEMAKGAVGALTVQHGVFVMPVYLSEPVATAEPQTMERKKESVMIKGVTWQSEPAYDGNVEGTYVFTAVLPEGYALADGVSLPQITVTVQGTDPVVQELLARIDALPEAEAYLADEPDVEAEDEYEAWMDELSAYTAEALGLWEMYETFTEEQRAQIPTEALVKLAAWVELAGQLAESSQVMAAADGWQTIANSTLEWQLVDGTLTIRGSGAMPDWGAFATPWNNSRSEIITVVINDGVTSIGSYAFNNFDHLTSVTIPDSVTSIGYCGMNMCKRLKGVTIPSGMTTIGENAFSSDTAMESMIIPENVKSIGANAFSGCTALAKVTFRGTSTIPTLTISSITGCRCVEDGVKGLEIPTCKYLTNSIWSQYYKDHVTKTHTLTHTAEVPATCVAAGTKEFWTCSGCQTKFSDAAGTKVISAPVTIPATGHALTYTPNDTNDTIKQSCSNGCGHSSQAGFTDRDGVTVPCTYTGSELKPFIITRWQSWLGDLPSISYVNNINVGTATVTLSIDGASVSKTFTIVPKSLEDDSVRVNLDTNSPTYTGSAITPTAIVDDGGRRLTEDTDYTVSYQNNTEVSTNDSKANAVLTGKGNYAGTRTVPFTIYPRYLTSAVVTLDTDSLQYTGQALKPTVTGVTANGRTLTAGTDYTVSYNNNINAGSNAQVIVTGKGNYTGTCTKTFTITAKPLKDAMVTLNPASYPYTGNAITPDVAVKDGSTTLKKGTDYTVSCQNNTDASTTAKLTITGTGNYTGTLTKTFTITPKSLADVTVRLNPDSYPYTGEPIVPVMTVSDGSRTLTAGTHYTVKYENNTAIGTNTAKVIFTGMGNYTGTRTETFSIGKQSLSSAEVTLDAVSYPYIGQAIEPMVTKVILGGRTLTAGTDYTVSYQNNTNAGENAQVTIMGKDGYTGECVKKFTIMPKSLTDATVTATMLSDSHQYSGTGIEPTVTVRDSAIGSGGSELVKGRDYTVSCRNNKDVSTGINKAQVILTGMGNYAGTLTETFTITAKPLTDASVTAALPSTSYQYTGQAITPMVTVRDSAIGSGTALEKDRDYTVAYADNTAAGTNTAKVTVTGTGNYTGVRTLTFTIQDKAPEVSGDDLDFSGGTVKLPDDIKDKAEKGEVEIYGSDGKKITPKDDGSLPVEPGTTIKIKYPGSDKETEIQIPPRPAAPAPVDKEKIEKTDTTIKVPKPNDGAVYEYVLVEKGKDPDWNRSNTTGEFTGLDPNKEYDLYMRKQATEDSFASEPVKTEIRTSVTIKEPEISGAGGDNDVSEGKPSADGDSVTYTGTCEEGSTPVIIVGGKEVVPKITWDADGKKGTWSYTVPVEDGDSAVGIRVEFKDRVYKGLEIEPGSLRIHADNAANGSADALIDYLRAKCAVKLTYDNGASENVANGADYKTDSEFNAKGAVYEYTVEASADKGKVTLTVSPVTAAVKAPDALSKSLKPGGYTKAEVGAWLPASVTVSYTGADGYAQRTENRPVTWDTDGLGTGFGAAAGSKTISGTVDMPVWATGQNTASIAIVFADRRTLTDDQMQLSVSGWAYGTQTAPAPKGSVAVTDTEQTYTYSYSANGGASWVTAAGLPKSASGHIIPGGYLAKMTYTGRGYTGTKTTSFTVVQKPVTAEKGTLAVENRNYDGTTKATLKAGGKPALVGAIANDAVSLSGTLNAVFTNKGPKKDIPVTVTGFALTGRDAGYYKLVNTTLTLKATINNKDGSSPSGGSSSGSSGNTSGGDSGNSGNTGTGGNKGTAGNTGSNGGTTGTGNGTTGGTGKGSTGSGNITGTGKGDTSSTGKSSTGSGKATGTGKGTSGTGKGSTGSGKATGTGKGTSGTGKDSTGSGTSGTGKGTSGNGSGSTAGNRMIGNGGTGSGGIGGNGNGTTGGGKDSTGSGSGSTGSTDSGTGNGDTGAQQAGDGQQTKSVTVQTVQAAADDGRIVISGETEMPVAIGTLTEDAPGATQLLVGDGTVTVTVVCEDDQYTVGMNDATAVANAVLTPEQIQRVDAGESLEIRVDIKNISQSIPPEDRETVEKGYEAYEKYLPELTRGGYVDISVYMKTGEDGWNAVSETTEPLEVVIGIPEGLRGDGREYYIIRAHEGKYTLLNDMDAMPETITIVTDMFSSYAIAYREADAADAGNGEHVLPRFLGIVSLICLTAVVAGTIVVIIVLRRKKSCK